MDQALKDLSKSAGIDPDFLSAFIAFFKRHVMESPDSMSAFQRDPETILRLAIVQWHTQSSAYLQELLENKTPRAKAAYNRMASEVYDALRRRTQPQLPGV